MDVRQLKYFLTISEEGSISKAAEKLHMSQPPLSQQLKLLEDELGVKLLERNTRNLKLTDVGEALLYRSRQILDLVELTTKEVKDINAGFEGTLSIGTVSSAGAALLPEIINSFHKQYPRISFEILDEDSDKITELLKDGIIDIGIIRTPFNLEDFEYIYLPEEPLVIASSQVFWDENKKFINLSELSDKPLIMHRRYEKTILHLCHKFEFEPRIFCKSNDVRTILMWANTGLGTAIVPKDSMNLLPNSNLKYIGISEPSLMVGTAVIWSKTRYISSVTRHFIGALKK